MKLETGTAIGVARAQRQGRKKGNLVFRCFHSLSLLLISPFIISPCIFFLLRDRALPMCWRVSTASIRKRDEISRLGTCDPIYTLQKIFINFKKISTMIIQQKNITKYAILRPKYINLIKKFDHDDSMIVITGNPQRDVQKQSLRIKVSLLAFGNWPPVMCMCFFLLFSAICGFNALCFVSRGGEDLKRAFLWLRLAGHCLRSRLNSAEDNKWE